MNDKWKGYLPIAAKAGAVFGGEFQTEKLVQSGKACLVIIADDASDNTKKKVENLCKTYDVIYCTLSDREELGRLIGKDLRSSIVITDEGIAKAIKKSLNTDIQ